MNSNPIEKKIVEAAKVIFMKKGLEATRMQDIANEAGISRTSLNYYYRSKDKLFDAIVEKLINIFVPRITKIMGNKESFETKIDHLIDEFAELIIENPLYPYFLITEITRNPDQFVEIFKNSLAEIGGFEKLGQRFLMAVAEKKSATIDFSQFFLSILSLMLTPSLVWPVFSELTKEKVEFSVFLRNRNEHIKNILKSQID